MLVRYDPSLVLLSIVLAILGAYTCFELAAKLLKSRERSSKGLIIGAAFAIGGGIWSMHFVAMLALMLPVTIKYDLLLTIISSLVSILMTGVALIIVTKYPKNIMCIGLAGLIMGSGVSSMHYIGMAAVRGNCTITYAPTFVIISILISLVASTLALWLATHLGKYWWKILASVVMGLAIAGMHYTAMFAATFIRVDVLIEYSAPIMDPATLAIIVSIATFLIIGSVLLTFMPEENLHAFAGDVYLEDGNTLLEEGEVINKKESVKFNKLPVLKDRKTIFICFNEIAYVKANGHYSTIYTSDKEYFCSYSLTKLSNILDKASFIRVHRSYMININYAVSFEKKDDHGIILVNSKLNPSIPVSRSKVAALRKTLGI